MKKFANWIGAGIGWAAAGPMGAALGYLIGSVIKKATTDYDEFNHPENYAKQQTQNGDFEISLLFLSAEVIKADGKILREELDYVRNYFVKIYGKERANNAFKLFKGIVNDNSINLNQVCAQINEKMSLESRNQLIHFLFSIAKSDGNVSKSEIVKIEMIAGLLGISNRSFNSIKAMFYDSSESAYEILEISPDASHEEVKKSYRRLVKLHHPDKIRNLGEEHIKVAQEKFQKIQQAYETIKKERDI
ncbi:TerB family tellurite resistance protein [Wenyingzhuangia sp. IMCC45533]